MRTRTATVIALASTALLAPQMVSAQSGLTVPESSIATMVVDRTPSGTAMTFPASVERLYAWTRIQGADGEIMVHHVWIQGDVERADIELQHRGITLEDVEQQGHHARVDRRLACRSP